MTVTDPDRTAEETPVACSEWEHCAFAAGHAGVCRDIAGDPDPEQLGHEVDLSAARPVVAPNPAHAAIDAAARAALDQPGIPGRDEFLSLCMQARVLSMSALAPKALRDKPHDMLMILLVGRDLQIPTTSAIKQVYVVDGQPSLAPKLLNARIRRLGLGRIKPHPDNGPGWAAAIPLGPDGEELGPPVTFTWADAQRAGLVRMDCQPDEHSEACVRCQKASEWNVKKQACKDNYVHYPQRMCWWRACGNCADDYYPEASLGVYSPDELGALTDSDGNLVDVDSVEIPAGFERKGIGSGRSGGEEPDPAPDDVKAAVKRRIDALAPSTFTDAPNDATARGALMALWTDTGDGKDPLPAWHSLLARQVKRAEAMVASIEARARKGEWGTWTPPADPTTGEVTPPAEGSGDTVRAPAVALHGYSPDEMADHIGAFHGNGEAGLNEADHAKFHATGTPPRVEHEHTTAETGALALTLRSDLPADEPGEAATTPAEAPEADAATDAADNPDPPVEAPAGNVETGPEPDLLEGIIAEVKAMKPGQVVAELVKRGEDVGGTPSEKQQRLCGRLLRERLGQDDAPA